jgi:hypothetical protein
MDKPLPAHRSLLIADYVALLPLGKTRFDLHHLHIVSVVGGGGGGVAKVENVPSIGRNLIYYVFYHVKYLHWRF